jgi:hypothetical protein
VVEQRAALPIGRGLEPGHEVEHHVLEELLVAARENRAGCVHCAPTVTLSIASVLPRHHS